MRTEPNRQALLPPLTPIALLVLAVTTPGCSSPQHGTSVTEVVVERVAYDDDAMEDAPPQPSPPEEPSPAPAEPTFAGETSGPARRILETAKQMLDDFVVVRGSCYDYIAAVFDRAGFGDGRSRAVIFQGPRDGPYADSDQIQPGDWLFIIAYPEARPMGTHSVLFVRWEDQEAGEAMVVSYVGGRADRPAHVMTRDVSRTYAIQRARERP